MGQRYGGHSLPYKVIPPCKRTTSLLVAQPGDRTKRLDIATETSIVYRIGDLTQLKQKVLEQHPTGTGRQAGRQDMAAIIATWGLRSCHLLGELTSGCAHQLPGKLRLMTITRVEVV